ncbi:MAG: LysM peptidoglycan-binding domain-containing protein [Bacteroidales bacterium]|nr:LysM peptidoglycan-binding domain-containing protein [Bacteroidales bacterium]
MEKAYQNIDRNKNKITVVNGATGQEEVAQSSSSSSASTSSGPVYYRVKKGDTLSKIAKKYHTTVSKLCKLNKIKETTILQIGQKIKVRN